MHPNEECPNPSANVICLKCFGIIESLCDCHHVGRWCRCEKPRPDKVKESDIFKHGVPAK